jgi:hypothetical protein
LCVVWRNAHNFYKTEKVVPTLEGLKQKMVSSIRFKGGHVR